MAIQRRNDELVNMLSADLQLRRESGFAWRTACSMVQALTGLRGFWPMSAVGGTAAALDQSGNARTLTYNGNPVYGSGSGLSGGLAPWIRFDGTGDYLSRATEAGLDILGTEAYVDVPGLTLGGWFRPENDAAAQILLSKIGAVGNYSYQLYMDGTIAGDPVMLFISDDGTNFSTVQHTTTTSMNTWQFIAGRFNDADTGAEMAVWLNDELITGATARNAIFNGNGPFNISGNNNGASLYTGRASLCFLCAAALSDATVWAIYQQTRALFGV